MKTILTIIGVFFGLVPKCRCVQMGYDKPEEKSRLFCTKSKYSFDQLLNAIAIVESNGHQFAVGDNGKAIGLFQIHKICVDDVNRILHHPTFSYADRADPIKSRAMVSAYLYHYGRDKSIEAMARIHNGGPRGYKKESTIRYWTKVKRIMDNGNIK